MPPKIRKPKVKKKVPPVPIKLNLLGNEGSGRKTLGGQLVYKLNHDVKV